MSQLDVAIVGGGVAGLSCARQVAQAGLSFELFESGSEVGGRIRTDQVEGFLLDRGFQVLLDSYPECQEQLDYEALDLRPFESGALIYFRNRLYRFADPWRVPSAAWSTFTSPAATLTDKLRVASLRRSVTKQSFVEPRTIDDEISTMSFLQGRGMSDTIIERFFKPFFGGVFLESNLQTTSDKFQFLFRMFATGQATLPNKGMQAIPGQLAATLTPESIHTSCNVVDVLPNQVTLENGRTVSARAVVLATPEPITEEFLNGTSQVRGHGVLCLYFAAPKSPTDRPILVLNGEGLGPVNHVCSPSQAAPGYSQGDEQLISVSVLAADAGDRDELETSVRVQLSSWFGDEVKQWRHLKTYEIPFALPRQRAEDMGHSGASARTENGIYRCGDYRSFASIHGAMLSGRQCGEEIVQACRQSA